jgi:hypothetical protein
MKKMLEDSLFFNIFFISSFFQLAITESNICNFPNRKFWGAGVGKNVSFTFAGS